MLPVCSATTSCSCHLQIPVYGGLKSFSLYGRTFDFNFNNVDKVAVKFSNGIHLGTTSFKKQPPSCLYGNNIGNSEQWGSMGTSSWSLYQGKLGSVEQLTHRSYEVGVNDAIALDGSSYAFGDDRLLSFISETVDSTDIPSNFADPESSLSFKGLPIDPPLVLDTLDIDIDSLSGPQLSSTDIVNEINDVTANTINGAENVLNNSIDTITSSLKMALGNASEAVDNAINDITSFIDKSGESAGTKLTGLSSGVKEGSSKVGLVALDLLRQATVAVENSLTQGAQTVAYAYGSAKEYLPPEVQDTLSLSEESITKVLSPLGTAFQQVNIAVGGFEESLGLDPNDPLIPLVFFLGFSATLWGSYRILKYGGYAGDLSPEATMELLRGNEKVVLIDIRPEDLKERDGIPDLRRAARSRYASVEIPEVDDSVKKLLKGGRDLEDSLVAVVIRDLKNVEDRSKVLVMDADGTRSKGVARSLRKLGTKKPYLVQGGFRSWVNEGFRVKELKPETTFTILNEDVEAILEEINPTPLKLIGLGVGLLAATYALTEWEKTLQFVGVIGLGQTIYRRLASYQTAEDLKQDVSLLLAPVRLGSGAITWATGKLESSRNGLPTSPSSDDVRTRVLQAAAKHQSQPSDSEETQDSSSQVVATSGTEDVNISEA